MRRTDDTARSPRAAPDRLAQSRRGRGCLAEELAGAYLQLRGFTILERNYRDGPREVDLIAKVEDWLVIVEVRYRSSRGWGDPEESVRTRKRRHLRRAGQAIWITHGRDLGLRLRFDLIAIEPVDQGLILRHHRHFLNPESGL